MLTDVRLTRRGARGCKRGRPTRSRLLVERLEDRCLLSFQVLGTLGTPVTVPTGPAFRINDFEPNAINNRGDVLYGDDLGTANDPATFFGEGIFLRSHGQETVLASSTAPAPGGGTFDFGFLGPSTLNDSGDAAFAFTLSPVGSPFGVNAGTFRYSHNTQTVTPVVLPGVTPAPGGGTFAGTFFTPSIDNAGNLVFAGIVPTGQGVHIPGEDYIGLGLGVFRADKNGRISAVVVPGDPAPGGGTFDAAGEYTSGPWLNDRGDIAFSGHVVGEEAAVPGFPPQADFISTLGNVYLRDGATGRITAIAQEGDPAPGGGVFRQATFPTINSRGDVLFTGDLTPAPGANQTLGIFLYSGGKIIPIARPEEAVPDGGHIVTTSVVGGNSHLNNQDDVVFNAALDTSHNGIPDTGLFEWSHGQLTQIVRSGTVVPGVGTVANLTFNEIVIPPPPVVFPNSGVTSNDRGQVLFGATLTDGRGVMLLYTPTASGASGGARLDAVAGSAPLAAGAGPSTAATGPAAAGDGTGQPGAALRAALVVSTIPPPLVGQAAVLTVQPASNAGPLSVPGAGPGGGSIQVSPPPVAARLVGALTPPAVDALFTGLGSNPLGDPFASGPF